MSIPIKRLSTNAFLLFEQATHIAVWNAGRDDKGDKRRLLTFARTVRDDNGQSFWQIAAYACGDDDRVLSWRERYDLSGAPGAKRGDVLLNLMYCIINDLIQPHLIENLRS